jgi:hypothetical protein
MQAVVYHPDAPNNGVTHFFQAEEADVLLNLALAAEGSETRILDGTPFAGVSDPKTLPPLAALDTAIAAATD